MNPNRFLVTCALLFCASARAVNPAHQLVTCAALLTDPHFDALGARRTAPWPDTLPPARESLPYAPDYRDVFEMLAHARGGPGRLRVTEFEREFVGVADIKTYFNAVIARVPRVVEGARGRGARGERFWTWARLGSVGFTLFVPTAVGAEVVVLAFDAVTEPRLFALFAVPAATVSGALAWLSRGHFARVGRALKTFGPARWRDVVRATDAAPPDDVRRFLEWHARVRADAAPYDLIGPTLAWPATAELARLLIEPPRADAHPVERENFDGLLAGALATSLNDENILAGGAWRFVCVTLRAYRAPGAEVPRLLVTTRIIKPIYDSAKPRRRVDAAAAPTPALGAPAPVRAR